MESQRCLCGGQCRAKRLCFISSKVKSRRSGTRLLSSVVASQSSKSIAGLKEASRTKVRSSQIRAKTPIISTRSRMLSSGIPRFCKTLAVSVISPAILPSASCRVFAPLVRYSIMRTSLAAACGAIFLVTGFKLRISHLFMRFILLIGWLLGSLECSVVG